MLIYIINFVANMALGLAILGPHPREASPKRRAVYLIITALQLALLCGLRAECMAYDTKNYIRVFNLSVQDMTTGEFNSPRVELGFYYLCQLIGRLGGTPTTLFLICSLFIMGATCLFVYRHSENVLFSVFILLSFPYYYTSFDIMRHYIALAFFLLAYRYLEEKKFIPFAIIVMLGFPFHKVAVFFLLIYLVRYLKNSPLTWAFFFTGSVVFCFHAKEIAGLIVKVMERFANYTNEGNTWLSGFGGGIKTAVLYGAILTFALILYNNLESREECHERDLHYVLLLFCFSVVFINVRMMIRFMVSFIPLLAIAFPRLNNRENARDPKTATFITYAFLGLGLFYHAFMLWTNWQNIGPYVSIFEQ